MRFRFITCMLIGLLAAPLFSNAALPWRPPLPPPWWHPSPPPPPTPPPPTTSDVVGYFGCSMTMGIGNGLKSLGSTAGWQPVPDYSGAGVSQWAGDLSDNNKYWRAFQAAYDAQPTNIILWELCAIESTKSKETLEAAKDVIDEVKLRVPNATVYVSSQPYYSPSSHTCTIAGPTGVDRMAGLVASLVSEGYAKQGPVFGPLLYPSQTIQDGCHPNSLGEELMGTQFINFDFSPIGDPTPDPGPDPDPTPTGSGIASGIYVVDTEPGVDTALASPSADGLLVRSQWSTMEKTEGAYDFSSVCTKITKAYNLGKGASIVNYTIPPSWLVLKVPTSEQWSLQMGRTVTTINPWNEVGLTAMQKLAEAEANFVCGGYPLKSHPAVRQIDTTIFGALSIRDKPSTATLEQMRTGIVESVKIWHNAFAVADDPKAYYFSTFPLGRGTTAVEDSVSIVNDVLALYPMQHTFEENWDLSGAGNTTPLTTSPYRMMQACGVFSDSSITCSATGQTGNTPKAAYDAVLKPLGGFRSLQIYPADFSAYPSDLEYLHNEMNP